MKFNIKCAKCNTSEEIELEENEAKTMKFACAKCQEPATLYNPASGEQIQNEQLMLPGVVVYEANSMLQVIIPLGLCKDEIIRSLQKITNAVESDGGVEGVNLAEVAISMENDRMTIIKRSFTESCTSENENNN